jgi:hypothetical protein
MQNEMSPPSMSRKKRAAISAAEPFFQDHQWPSMTEASSKSFSGTFIG